MSQQSFYGQPPQERPFATESVWPQKPVVPRNSLAVGVVLLVALVAFEMFNFDTTRYALNSLLGDVRFLGLSWAAILAIAFCAIDFAGLVRFFMPEERVGQSKEYWYLMGAWLLGATMNAIMTWWAVSLTLLSHDLGNEVLSRAQLLEVVPIFVAVLVWLTRILFIGALTVAGSYLFVGAGQRPSVASQPLIPQPRREAPRPQPVVPQPSLPPIDSVPAFLEGYEERVKPPMAVPPRPAAPRPVTEPVSRIQRRPPMPAPPRPTAVPMAAKGRNQGEMR